MANSRNNPEQTATNSNVSSEEKRPPQDELDIIAKSLHAIGDTATVAHMGGLHIKGPLKFIGPIAEIGAEIIHNPSGDLAEKLVCGTGVALAKEAINLYVGTEIGTIAGIAATTVSTPLGGAIVGSTVGIGAYKLTQTLTEPMGQVVEKACHETFETARSLLQDDDTEKSNKSNWKNIDDTINKLNEINEAIRFNKNDPALFYQRAKTHLALNAFTQALEDNEKAYALDSDYAFLNLQHHYIQISGCEWYTQKARIALDNNDYLQAKLEATTALSFYEMVEALMTRGIANTKLGMFFEAENDFNQLIDIDNTNPEFYLERANLYLSQKDFDRTFADIDKALSLPQEKSKIAFNSNDSQATLRLAKQAIQLNPKNILGYEDEVIAANYYQCRAQVNQLLNDFNSAMEDCDKAIQLDPNNTLLMELKNEIIENIKAQKLENILEESFSAYDLEDFDNALNLVENAIQLDPYSVQAFAHRGNCYIGINDLKKAENDFSTAIQLDPTFSPSYNNLAYVSYALGKFEQALFNSIKFLELEPNHESGIELKQAAVEQIENLKQKQAEYERQLKEQQRQQAAERERQKKLARRASDIANNNAMFASTRAMNAKITANSQARSHFIDTHSLKPTNYASSANLQAASKKADEQLKKFTDQVRSQDCSNSGTNLLIEHHKRKQADAVKSADISSLINAPSAVHPNSVTTVGMFGKNGNLGSAKATIKNARTVPSISHSHNAHSNNSSRKDANTSSPTLFNKDNNGSSYYYTSCIRYPNDRALCWDQDGTPHMISTISNSKQ